MKKIVTFLFIIISKTAFCQYGPVAYRTLAQTIGEKYIILPQIKSNQSPYYSIHKFSPSGEYLTYEEGHDKILTLLSLDDKKGHFIDSARIEYWVDQLPTKTFFDLAPYSDYTDAVKLFLGKTLWMNTTQLRGGAGYIDEQKYGIKGMVEGVRFKPVKVIDIFLLGGGVASLTFILKTPTGEIGYKDVTLSGTNTPLLNKEDWFQNTFFTQDPTTIYHFTPAVWKMVKNYDIRIGMPAEAVELLLGHPDARHNTKTATKFSEQWVYGTTNPSYYYFENGKLTAIQN